MLAYLIQTHSSPRQLARLVNALNGPEVEFFVHVDRKVDTGQFRYLMRRQRNVHFVFPRQIIEWGGWAMVEAELILIKRAIRAGATHMTLLSGTDYPVWSNRRLTEFFLSTNQNFVEHFRIPSVYWDRGALNRVRQYWLCDDPIRMKSELWYRTFGKVWRSVWHRVIRRYTNLAFKVGYEIGIHRKMPANMAPYVGSQWWSISRECGEYLLDFVRSNPKVVRFYRHSHVPDEGFIQTVLMNSPLKPTIVNDNLRYVEWDGGFNPRVLEIGDLDAVVKSGSAFARKLSLNWIKDVSGRSISSEALMLAMDARRKAEEETWSAQRAAREIELRNGKAAAREVETNGHGRAESAALRRAGIVVDVAQTATPAGREATAPPLAKNPIT